MLMLLVQEYEENHIFYSWVTQVCESTADFIEFIELFLLLLLLRLPNDILKFSVLSATFMVSNYSLPQPVINCFSISRRRCNILIACAASNRGKGFCRNFQSKVSEEKSYLPLMQNATSYKLSRASFYVLQEQANRNFLSMQQS